MEEENITYTLEFEEQALKDVQALKKSEKSAYNKLLKLLDELTEHPRTGAGKPEALKHDFSGYYSRRITQKHRLPIYQLYHGKIMLMKHPNQQIQKNQDEFLKQCPESEREFHARLFRIGNAAYRYHQLAASSKNEIPESLYHEWLEGLPASIRMDMEKQGFEKCKPVLSFIQYVNERRDTGMDEWMKEHLSEDDYSAYKQGII